MLKKLTLLTSIILFVVALVGAAMAADTAPGTSTTYNGRVTKVDTAATPNTITIHNRTTGDKTFNVTADTKITVDKVEGKTLGDVKEGMRARIESADGTAATSIKATTAKPRQNAPAPTPAPAAAH